MTGPVKDYLDRYAYPRRSDPRYIVFEADDARYMNHADDPNCDFGTATSHTRCRDIAPGEEMTCDYNVSSRTASSFWGIGRRSSARGCAAPSPDSRWRCGGTAFR